MNILRQNLASYVDSAQGGKGITRETKTYFF